MTVIERYVNRKLFSITSEEYLEEQAEALIKLVGSVMDGDVKDLTKIHIGWNIYTVVKKNRKYVIYAPDYARNPFKDNTVDLTIPLWVQFEQSVILHRLGIEGETISFFDKVICGKGVLEMNDIYLERNEEHEEGDSGWYIGPVDEEKEVSEFEAYYAYELIGIRPSLIQLLALPSGYVVVMEKDNIQTILNQNNIEMIDF